MDDLGLRTLEIRRQTRSTVLRLRNQVLMSFPGLDELEEQAKSWTQDRWQLRATCLVGIFHLSLLKAQCAKATSHPCHQVSRDEMQLDVEWQKHLEMGFIALNWVFPCRV